MQDRKDKTVLTVGQLADKIGADLYGDAHVEITGVNTIDLAGQTEVSFIASDKHISSLAESSAAAVIVSRKFTETKIAQLVVGNVDAALITTMNLFAPKLTPLTGLHPTAVIEQSANIGADVAIGAGTYIAHGVSIGDGSQILTGCFIGENTTIGANTRLDSNVVVYHNCKIGNNCVILANTTIGSTGFGYSFIDGQHRLIPHNGSVVIEDCVDIGANCCIDRAKFGNTLIGAGTKIDNLVQIAHNVVIGKCSVLASLIGISGSTVLGNGVVMGGQAGIKDHITVGDGVRIGGRAGVINDIDPGQTVLGMPAMEARQQTRNWVAIRRLPEMIKQIKELTEKVDKLEEHMGSK